MLSSSRLLRWRPILFVLGWDLTHGCVLPLGRRLLVISLVLGLTLQVYDARPDPGTTEFIRVPDGIVDRVKRGLESKR